MFIVEVQINNMIINNNTGTNSISCTQNYKPTLAHPYILNTEIVPVI